MYYVYILRCADDTLYTGYTPDLTARLAAHNSGKGAKYTRGRHPVTLAFSEVFEDRHEALGYEYSLKQLSREEKLRLIAGQNDPDVLRVRSFCHDSLLFLKLFLRHPKTLQHGVQIRRFNSVKQGTFI